MQIPSFKQRRWTKAALDCYDRNCNCTGCYYSDFFADSRQKCQMKKSVMKLIQDIGRPRDTKELTFVDETIIDIGIVMLATRQRCRELFNEKHVTDVGKWQNA